VRAVVDTNILVRAVLKPFGTVGPMVDRLEDAAYTLVYTGELLADPKDDMVLEAAVTGHADVIVTGDQDLLVLSPFEGIPIVGPAEFLAILGNP
jgi:predicted nucleic acid-binding protein